jgi:hypothetical protein
MARRGAMKRRLAAVIVALVLVAPVQAWAECAWVLWEESYWLDAKRAEVKPAKWSIMGSFPQAGTCEGERSNRAKEQARQTLSLTPQDVEATGGAWGLRFLCLPDTIDPRGPKGGGR